MDDFVEPLKLLPGKWFPLGVDSVDFHLGQRSHFEQRSWTKLLNQMSFSDTGKIISAFLRSSHLRDNLNCLG
ncbi:hypothetical protein CWATWH8502_4713 [Crocosphaera watsonii WH 8502]|uniref:Uncharacterized protein n=1 Tax=Crocosphaera watsonii WH 8502 TaxID=423474 RepID=T2ILS0_CROWT|nr:hypothetical protein CWATWH8502_4713 [Crocosphaera watsonii WH 8502]